MITSKIRVNVTFRYAWWLKLYIAAFKLSVRLGFEPSMERFARLFEKGCTCEVKTA